MPLDTRHINHIKNKMARTRVGRTQTVALVLKLPDNTTSTLTADALWRPMVDADPSLAPANRVVLGDAGLGGSGDVLASFLATDVTLAQLRSCIYAYPASPYPDEPATRYLITSITPRGMMAGGDRYVCTFTRQR